MFLESHRCGSAKKDAQDAVAHPNRAVFALVAARRLTPEGCYFVLCQCSHCSRTARAPLPALSASTPAIMSAAAPAAAHSSFAPSAPLPPVVVSHRLAGSGPHARALAPWAVHVFQGRPAHQNDSDESDASGSALPQISPEAAAAPLPFAAPTSKADHESHDLRALSPEQAAAYANEYGKVEQALEIEAALRRLRYRADDGSLQPVCESVRFHQVSVKSIGAVVARLQAEQSELDYKRSEAAASLHPELQYRVPQVVVMNLCDGTEDDGYPGVTIARALMDTMRPEARTDADAAAPAASSRPRRGLAHTGADPPFFHTTTEKIVMKQCFREAHVRSSNFVDLTDMDLDTPVDHTSVREGGVHASLYLALAPSASFVYPLIIKPSSSYSSCGLTSASVVDTPLAALVQAQKLRRELGKVIAEEFVDGREFSMLIVGDWDGGDRQLQLQDGATAASASASSPSTAAASSHDHLRCYTACERVFSSSLPASQRFLTFEQNYPTAFTELHTWWSSLDVSSIAGHAADQAALASLAKQAYVSCKGRSYGRVDLRQNAATGECFCLEVNSLPGLSGEQDSSVGAILSHATPRREFSQFLYAILFLAATGTLDDDAPVAKLEAEATSK